MPGLAKQVVKRVSSSVADTPPVRSIRGLYYERQFKLRPGTFRGIYGSFAEALRSAPPAAALGYDHPELAELYRDRHNKILPSDYPMIFWLDRIFRSASSLFDFGGHLGIQFYSYGRYLTYPPGLRWTVLDVAAIVEKGRALARERGRAELGFTTDLADAADHDVFMASGSLQYVETPLAQMLKGLRRLPPHVLLNKVPLCGGESYVTLQNVQFTYSAYGITNRAGFVNSLTALGYEVVDAWENADMFCRQRLDPERSVEAYSGLYLRLPKA